MCYSRAIYLLASRVINQGTSNFATGPLWCWKKRPQGANEGNALTSAKLNRTFASEMVIIDGALRELDTEESIDLQIVLATARLYCGFLVTIEAL